MDLVLFFYRHISLQRLCSGQGWLAGLGVAADVLSWGLIFGDKNNHNQQRMKKK